MIYLIHHQLIDEATVTESKFLYDRAANVDREVDIVIEIQAGDYPVIIGIECQGRCRVANVEWVEQMAAKHASLPTNKLILVSQSGFSSTARKKAEALGIRTMTLSQAIRSDWIGLVGQATMLLVKWGIEPVACFAVFSQYKGQRNTLQLDFNQQLYDREGYDVLIVNEAIEIIMDIQGEDLIKQMKQPDIDLQKPYTVFEMEFGIPAGTYLVDLSGTKQEINSFLIIGHCVRETELVDLKSGSFGSAQVAFGKTRTIDAKSLISIVEHEDKPNTAALMLPSENKNIIRIINLKEAKE